MLKYQLEQNNQLGMHTKLCEQRLKYHLEQLIKLVQNLVQNM